MATIPRTTFTITQARTLRITVNGAPAVLPVSGFMPCADENVMIFTPVTDDPIYADETIEDLAALWDAAAPSPPEQEPDEWQDEITNNGRHPCEPPGTGREPLGPWEPVSMAASDEWHAVLWRRPLRRVAE